MARGLSFYRTPLQFPVKECMGCFLSSATRVGGETYQGVEWKGIRINHAIKIQDLRKDREGTRNLYFKDLYFIKDISDVEWTLGYFINILGGKPPLDYDGVDDYIDKTVEVFNSLKGTSYYLKTRLVLEKEDKLYLRRGLHPYISKEADLSYRDGEDEYHKHIINFKRYN